MTIKETQLDIKELVRLAATNDELYAQAFFPRAFRQSSPPFAGQIWDALDNPHIRYLNLLCFRGAAKTTRLRVFGSKRIAYGLSRTILCVSASERDAIRSVQWLRGNVEKNTKWASAFGLRPGKKWEETQIEIEHTGFNHTIWVLAAGITGSLRGINFDDYRPDLILLDDPQTDEMAATEEQRLKTHNLVLGALKNSLAPRVDDPNAKFVMCATPIAKGDVTELAENDQEWTTLKFPCWTKETMSLPVEKQVSSWEERFPTAELRAEKMNAAKNNKLSVFLREKEIRLVSTENSAFKTPWLNIRDFSGETLRGIPAVLGIDPVPPPSDRERAKGLVGKDYECHYVWGRYQGQYHLLEAVRNRGHDPSWSVATALALAHKWRVMRIVPEAVAYQRVLKWHLEQEMRRRGVYFAVVPPKNSYQNKYARITGVLHPLATQGLLWIGKEHTEFLEQFEQYPAVAHDDDLDASAIALQDLTNPWLERPDGGSLLDDDGIDVLPAIAGACP